MANAPGTHNQETRNASSSSRGPNPGNGNPGLDRSGTGLKHNPGISMDWTPEEQAILEEGLAKYSKESSINCYTKIAMQLQDKTVRDVAMRCRWMTKKENSKRRKEDNTTRKSKDKKVMDPSAQTSQRKAKAKAKANSPPHATPVDDDGVSFKDIGGVEGELLEQNAQALNQISKNLSAMKLKDNIGLLTKTRGNLRKLMKDMDKDMPELMKRMPPLPVKLNEELANTILPPVKLSVEEVNAVLSRPKLRKK